MKMKNQNEPSDATGNGYNSPSKFLIASAIGIICFSIINIMKMNAADDSYLFLAGYSTFYLLPLHVVCFAVISALNAALIPSQNWKVLAPIAMVLGALPFCNNIRVFILLVAVAWIPYCLIRRHTPPSKIAYIAVLSTVTVALFATLFMPPHNWYEHFRESKRSVPAATEEKKAEQLALYEQFIDSWPLYPIEYFDISSTSFNSEWRSTQRHEYTATPLLIEQIAAILKETPVEYYHYPYSDVAYPDSNFSFYIRVSDIEWDINDDLVKTDHYYINFYYGFNESFVNASEKLGIEGKTFVRFEISHEVNEHERYYFTIDNKYIDEIFVLLEEYAEAD